MKKIIRDADFAISGQVGVTGEVLRAATRLKLLHKWGVGVDNLDVETARALGIKVARTTGSNALPVAEFTIGLMLSTLRFQALGHERLRQGQWIAYNQMPGETFLLSGRTVGIVGFGAIGQNVAKLLKGFGCTILYTQAHAACRPRRSRRSASNMRRCPICLRPSDVVSLHCPLTPRDHRT